MNGRSRRSGAAVAVAVMAVAVFCGAPARADENQRIIPVNEAYGGLTYGQWAAAWWQWALSIPAGPNHPFSPGGDTVVAQSGRVWFLAAVFGTEVRHITVPSGVALFIPVVNAECSIFEGPPFHGDEANSLATCANGHIDNTANLSAEIDGKSVKNLRQYRTRSPAFTVGPLPDPNIIGVPANQTTQSVDAGVYLLVSPLKPGHHTIRVKGTFTAFGVSIDTKYHITVTP